MTLSWFRKAAAACAVLVSFAAVPTADATQLYWRYNTYSSMADCLYLAQASAQSYGLTNINATPDEVTGEYGQYVMVSIVCIPYNTQAIGMVSVAADGNGDQAIGIRDAIYNIMQSGGGGGRK